MGKHDIIILLLDKNTPKPSEKLEKKNVKGENQKESKPVSIPKSEENKANSFKNIAANEKAKEVSKKADKSANLAAAKKEEAKKTVAEAKNTAKKVAAEGKNTAKKAVELAAAGKEAKAAKEVSKKEAKADKADKAAKAAKAAKVAEKKGAAEDKKGKKAEGEIIKQGIENHGNTCFINASLQAFIGLDKFIDNFVKLDSNNYNINIVRDIFKTILEGKGTNTKFELALDKLLEIHEHEYELIPTNNSRKIMNKKKNQSKKFSIFSNSKLNKNRYLTKKNNNNNKLTFNNLKNFKNNDIIYYHINKYTNGLKTQLKQNKKYKISFNNGNKYNLSTQQDVTEFIEHLFGIFESVKYSHSESFIYNDFNIETQDIHKIYLSSVNNPKLEKVEPLLFPFISIAINGKSIKECIDSYLKEEVMKGDNKLLDIHNTYCKNMKLCYCDQEKVKKKINIIKCPKYLIIQLKRFDYNVNVNITTKNKDPINFEEKLVLNQIKDNSTVKHNYDLVSIIVHIGQNPKSGHYICYSKRNNNWYEFNDSKVTIKNFNDLKKELVENGYMFFYQKSSTN